MRKSINNVLNGHHLNSTFWQDYKRSLPLLPLDLFDITVGIVLGDATMYKVSREAYIKFEQGYKQELFVDHLFDIFKRYTFMVKPGKRFEKSGLQKGLIKSFWFKTFSHQSFTELYNLFYLEIRSENMVLREKRISENLIRDYLTPRGLAYWIMCYGSLQNDKRSIILHTQSFTLRENTILSDELNTKFLLNSRVIPHKKIYTVILIPAQNDQSIREIIKEHIIDSMSYKVPV